MTSATPGDSFDLKSDLREAMLTWMRDNLPGAHAPMAAYEPDKA